MPYHMTDNIQYYLDPRLDRDPGFLESHLARWASIPPRPFVRLYGYHRERVDHNGKKEAKNVTDFDVQVELTPYLYSDATNHEAWHELRTVESGEKAKRGTVFKQRARGTKQSIELGSVQKASLSEWCHRYCASPSGLKAFSLRRQMHGFDHSKVKEQLQALVCRTGYRGHLDVSCPVRDEFLEVWNDCKTNRWRLTGWIYMLFSITLLFLFTWPYLFLRTKRFETVSAVWSFSRLDENGHRVYASVTEDQWYNLWGRALCKAVLSKRQGLLDQQDLVAAEGPEPTFNTSNPAAGSALAFVRAGVNAMNEVNRQLGWGEDLA